MRNVTVSLVAVIVVAMLASAVSAHPINQPVKFSQTPWDPAGIDWLSDHTMGQVMADDFVCDDPDPIDAVRWWGSYPQGTSPTGGLWDISFHFSVGPHPTSVPGTQVYFASVTPQELFVGFDNAGTAVYQYDAYLPQPFEQWEYSQDTQNENVGELFIDICKPSGEGWGWHEVVPPHPRMDFAAFAPTHVGTWASTQETDMAFELMKIPEPGTAVLAGMGLTGLVILAWRRRRR